MFVARSREDARGLQIEGGNGKAVTGENDGSMYAPCHLKCVAGASARDAHPFHCGDKSWMNKGTETVLQRLEVGCWEICRCCLDGRALQQLALHIPRQLTRA